MAVLILAAVLSAPELSIDVITNIGNVPITYASDRSYFWINNAVTAPIGGFIADIHLPSDDWTINTGHAALPLEEGGKVGVINFDFSQIGPHDYHLDTTWIAGPGKIEWGVYAAAPEPSTFVLLILPLAGFLLWRWRRKVLPLALVVGLSGCGLSQRHEEEEQRAFEEAQWVQTLTPEQRFQWEMMKAQNDQRDKEQIRAQLFESLNHPQQQQPISGAQIRSSQRADVYVHPTP